MPKFLKLYKRNKGKFRKTRKASTRYVQKVFRQYERKHVERKWLHTSISQQIQSTGTTIQLTSVPQGDSENQRDGRKIYVKSLNLRFSWTMATSPFNSCRIIVFVWRGYPVGGTQPLVLDILESQSVQAHYAHKSSGQFQILYDKVFVMDDNRPHVERSIHLRRKKGWNKVIEFDPTPASYSRHSNGLQLLLITDDSVTPYPLFQGIAHVVYTDS